MTEKTKSKKARLKILYNGEVVGVEEAPQQKKTDRIIYWGNLGFQVEEVRKEEYKKLLRMLEAQHNLNVWRHNRRAELI